MTAGGLNMDKECARRDVTRNLCAKIVAKLLLAKMSQFLEDRHVPTLANAPSCPDLVPG